MLNAVLEKPFVRSLFAFGIVGVSAAATHVVIGLTLVHSRILEPFNANIIAFLTAFMVSYLGHKRFTFQSKAKTSQALPRFFIAAVLGLGLNQIIVFVCVNQLGWEYLYALAIVIMVVPATMYIFGKYWAFKERDI